jgi:pyrophosphate--fructose-6-phosphate 1-phosphotransferase
MQTLIHSLNDLLAAEAERFAELTDAAARAAWVSERLESGLAATWRSLPTEIQAQLVMDRDPHGNVQVSRIETEKLLADMVATELAARKTAGRYNGKFSSQSHFLGYEGRAAFPTNFDANYCYSLGYCAAILAARGQTGYLSSVRNLHRPTSEWTAGGVPLTMMMNMERRHGALKPVIRKALVDLDGRPFRDFTAQRDRWAVEGDYAFPGAVQYFGPDEVCNTPSMTLRLEQEA